MRFPLDGKFSKATIFFDNENKSYYIRKIFTLESTIALHEIVVLCLRYKNQLQEKIRTTSIISITIDYGKNCIIFVENFNPKLLEILIATSQKNRVKKYFRKMLDIIDNVYHENGNPDVVIEAKPSNFLLDRNNKLIYCDLMPPRILQKGKLEKKLLDFPEIKTKHKLKELEFRFLNKVGALYYLILHTASIRSDMLNYFLKESMKVLKSKKLKTDLLKLITSEKFYSELNRFIIFYTKRRTLYKLFKTKYMI